MIYVRSLSCAPPMGQLVSQQTQAQLERAADRAGEFVSTPMGKAVVVGLVTGIAAKVFPGRFLAAGLAGFLAATRSGVTGLQPTLPGIPRSS